jgi:hypothetical protein
MHAVIEVPELQKLMRHICKNGHAHHAAVNASHVADILAEAFEDYLRWDVKGGDAISSKELVNKPLTGINKEVMRTLNKSSYIGPYVFESLFIVCKEERNE